MLEIQMNNNQIPLIDTEPLSKLESLSREQLIEQVLWLKKSNALVLKVMDDAFKRYGMTEEERLNLKDQLLIIRHKMYGGSSEKRPKPKPEAIEEVQKKAKARGEKNTDPRVLLPSLRYPKAPLKESHVTFEIGKEPPCCLCEEKLLPMGDQTEDSEWVSVTEKIYYVQRQKRQKYRCENCHGDIKTAPAIPRIAPGSGFSDEMAIDIAIAKYCDHLPINRYVKQVERSGLIGISPQSLIEQTHYLADFLSPLYEKLKKEIQSEAVLGADETPWKMLEGDDRKRWQLWGFFTGTAAYYEAHNTRAAEVAHEFLKNCSARYLLSDAYCGYPKCTRGTTIKNAFCHAHARRRWKEASPEYPTECEFMLEGYDKLTEIEREIKHQSFDVIKSERERRSKPILLEMKEYASNLWCLPKSSVGKARSYFLDYFDELSCFIEDGQVPIDNNRSERGLRGPVLGRKNFYGNHSKRGARTMQVLYSIIESCKLCKVEPHKYFKDAVKAMHQGEDPPTPLESALKSNNTNLQ
jgi:transposase